MNTKEYLIIHHTGGTNANPLADTSHHTFEIVKNYHLSLGWEDIGYNWFIDKTGKVTKGRSEEKQGAHTIGYNERSLGVCLAGNFDATLPTQEQINALKTLLSSLRTKYNIPLDKIVPHRKFANKTCYGNKLPDTWARSLVDVLTPKQLVQQRLTELQKAIDAL